MAVVEMRDDKHISVNQLYEGKEKPEFRNMIKDETVKFEVEKIRVRNERTLQNKNYISNL